MSLTLTIPLLDRTGLLNTMLVDAIEVNLRPFQKLDENQVEQLKERNKYLKPKYRKAGITFLNTTRWRYERKLKFSGIHIARYLLHCTGLRRTKTNWSRFLRNTFKIDELEDTIKSGCSFASLDQALSIWTSNLTYAVIQMLYRHYINDLGIERAMIVLNRIELAKDEKTENTDEKLIAYQERKDNRAVLARDVTYIKDNLTSRRRCTDVGDRTDLFDIVAYNKEPMKVDSLLRQEVRLQPKQLGVRLDEISWCQVIKWLNDEILTQVFTEGRILLKNELDNLKVDFSKDESISLLAELIPTRTNKSALERVIRRIRKRNRMRAKPDERRIIMWLVKHGILESIKKYCGVYAVTRKGLLLREMIKR